MLTEQPIQYHAQQIVRDGYAILANAVELDLVDALVADLERLARERDPARSSCSAPERRGVIREI